MNPLGNWPLPHAEDQFSHIVPQDTDGCVSYSAVHCIESQIKYLFGSSPDYSERFVAKMSGTTLQGNYVETVWKTIQKYGLVLDSDWPEPLQFTWAEYYADIPPEIITKGQEFLKEYKVHDLVRIDPLNVQNALQTSPLQVIIDHDTHAVEMVNKDQFFDSYPHNNQGAPQAYLLPVSSVDVDSYYQLLITKKMPFVKKTLNLKGAIGVFVAITDPSSLQDLNTMFGTNLQQQPDGSIPTDETA